MYANKERWIWVSSRWFRSHIFMVMNAFRPTALNWWQGINISSDWLHSICPGKNTASECPMPYCTGSQPGITGNERLSPLLSFPNTHTHRSAATHSAWALVTYYTVNDLIINQSNAWIVAQSHNDTLSLWNDQVRCCTPTKWGPSGRSSSAL